MSEASGVPARPAASRSQTDVVIEGVKSMIVSGELRAGARLPIEKDLAGLLGVSRGSLREGVRALVILGVLETRQGDGTYVTSLDASVLLSPLGMLGELQSAEGAADLLAVRRLLEGESVARAASRIGADALEELAAVLDSVEPFVDSDSPDELEQYIRADTEFHRIIGRQSGNSALASLIESLVGETFRTRLWRAIADRGAVRRTQDEHRAILAELRRGDPERARIRMAAHVLGVEDFASEHSTDDEQAPRSAE